MADPRSVMQEFRFLDQKRQAGALTPAEAARHAELRDLVGFEPPLPVRGGFDVNAAAARLRESLLPAGLRSRPLDSPQPPPPEPPPEPPPAEPPAAVAGPAVEPFFEPAWLGQDARPQAWNPEAPGYDPDAPYDEAAWIAAGYDPSVTYDWSTTGATDPSTPAGEPAADLPSEPAPLQLGEYDAPGGPVAAGDPPPLEELPPAPAADGGGSWFDAAGPAVAPPPLAAPSFGEYDDSPPLVLGEAVASPAPGAEPTGWLSEGDLDGIELASGGSFGGQAETPLPAPWAGPEAPLTPETWESVPALELSTPFEPILVPAPPVPATPATAEPPGSLAPTGPAATEEPIEELEPEPLEPLPEPGVEPPPAVEPAAPAAPDDLDASFEIDVPDEFEVADGASPDPSARLAFDSPAAGAAPPVPAAGAAGPLLVPVTAEAAEPEIEPVPAGPGAVVTGSHRVVVHTLDGEVLRGTLSDADLEAAELALEAGAPGQRAAIGTDRIKAIFFMLAPGEPAAVAEGRRVRVAFRDGRQVAGFSPDYREGGVGFFMIPVDTRTSTGRIWVYQSAVRQVTVS